MSLLRSLNNISIACTIDDAFFLMTCVVQLYSPPVLSAGALTVSEGQENGI